MIGIVNNSTKINKLQSYLAKEFEMKELGALKYLSGIEVSRSKQGLFLLLWKYILDLLAEIDDSTWKL